MSRIHDWLLTGEIIATVILLTLVVWLTTEVACSWYDARRDNETRGS